ncbi:hypothetical protein AAGS40_10280 [Paraburkholderia sp. PREW-6R]|uniref:hypothetical protein n=1 Tax=Paraburkholderia sp. PREW-6R TaxID=3141544 RepID=UPI0031F5A6E0
MLISQMARHAQGLRMIYAACFCGAFCTHLHVALLHGLNWDYGGVAPVTRLYWTSLLFIDPLVALLLLAAPRTGLALSVAVIVTDVAHNSWFALSHPIRLELYLSQIAFLLFVVATVRFAWQRAPRRRGECRGTT